MFEHEANRLIAQASPEGPASVNAIKQTCVIVMHTYLTYYNKIRSENAVKTLKYPFSSSLVIASLRTEYIRNCVDFAHAPRLKAGSVCTRKIGLLKSIG